MSCESVIECLFRASCCRCRFTPLVFNVQIVTGALVEVYGEILNLLHVKRQSSISTEVTFHKSRVQVIAPLINYQTTQIPLDLMEHFVKRLGLGDSFNVVHLSLSW